MTGPNWNFPSGPTVSASSDRPIRTRYFVPKRYRRDELGARKFVLLGQGQRRRYNGGADVRLVENGIVRVERVAAVSIDLRCQCRGKLAS